MQLKFVAAVIIFLQASCTGGQSQQHEVVHMADAPAEVLHFKDVGSIPLPAGFKRLEQPNSSFANWLRSISLKKDKTVYLYDGRVKPNQLAQFAVLDVPVGTKDLQQCADAIMRLRAEYLFAREDFDRISFTDNEGGVYQFTAPHTREHLEKYLQQVFGMCGTASLSKQLLHANMRDMQPGDVLIKGGFPGHAVIVMDMAENAGGEKIYLLAQSYMPAQDIHILKNERNETNLPWYELNDEADIYTPEYHFTDQQLKTWW